MEDITKKFKRDLFLIFFFPSLLAVIFFILAIVFFCKKRNSIGAIMLLISILIVALFLLVPYPPGWFFKDYNEELGMEPTINGVWVKVYDIGNNRVLKQISAPGVSHENFWHVKLPTLYRECTKKACTIPCMIAHKISTNQMWLSIERQLEMDKEDQERFFPKIYSVDAKRKRYVCDKVKYELSEDTCPVDFKEQIAQLNMVLKKYNLYLDDIHRKNIMVDERGRIKIIDGELYTDKEYEYKQKLLGNVDESQTEIAKGYKYGDRIRHWVDGRKNGENVCLQESFANYIDSII